MRVVVARPQPDADRTARRIAALGHEPVVAPLLHAVATPPPAAALAGSWDAVLLTSARAAAAPPAGWPAHLLATPLFAVGERSAQAARAAGFIHVRPAGGSARDLAAIVESALPSGARLLYLAGAVRKPDLEGTLRERGRRVDVVETYDVAPVGALPGPLADLLRSRADAVMLHYSRRSAEAALALAGAAGLAEPFRRLSHRALSPDVAEPLQRAGACDVVVAAAPDEDTLLATLPPCG